MAHGVGSGLHSPLLFWQSPTHGREALVDYSRLCSHQTAQEGKMITQWTSCRFFPQTPRHSHPPKKSSGASTAIIKAPTCSFTKFPSNCIQIAPNKRSCPARHPQLACKCTKYLPNSTTNLTMHCTSCIVTPGSLDGFAAPLPLHPMRFKPLSMLKIPKVRLDSQI
eukprot:476491-Pelagomonas_calceolata.AAC.2